MTSRSFSSRNAAAAFAKRVSKEQKTTVRLFEKDGKYFVVGEYPEACQCSVSSNAEVAIGHQSTKGTIKSSPISSAVALHPAKENQTTAVVGSAMCEAMEAAYLANGLTPPVLSNANTRLRVDRKASATERKNPKKRIPIKEWGLSSLKGAPSKSAIEKRRKIEIARQKLISERLKLEFLENRVPPQSPRKIITTTYVQGVVVDNPAHQRGNSICPRCGGDGGVNGGCGKCDGTGWI